MTLAETTRTIAAGLIAISLAGVAGCYESKHEFTLNPDGSGKVGLEVLVTGGIPFMDDKPAAGQKNLGKDTIGKLLGQSKGIDVWKDVGYELNEDGTGLIRGTAYFKDVSAVELGKYSAARVLWRRTGSNTYVLSLENASPWNREATPPPDAEESAAERKERLDKERKGWHRGRPFFAAIFSLFRNETTVHVPGSPATVSGLTNIAPNTVRLTLDSETAMEALDTIIADEELYEAYSSRHTGPTGDDADSLYGFIYELHGPFSAVVTNVARPCFDYALEVREAKAAYPVLLGELAAEHIVPLPPPAGADLKRVTVTGIRMVSEWDAPRFSRPFNANPGLALCVVAEFTGAAKRVDAVVLDMVEGDNGRSLRRAKKSRSSMSRRLIRDNTAVMMTFDLALPGPGVRTIRELAGSVRYTTDGINRDLDLGITELRAGAKGTQYGAEISSMVRSIWKEGKGQRMTLRMESPPRPIVSIAVYDGAGTKLKCLQEKHQANRGALRYEFRHAGGFPPEGRIVVELEEPEKTYDAPFHLKDIPIAPAFAQH